MAREISVKAAKELWNTWDIRVLILISLVIQVLLTFLAPLRKRSASGFLSFSLWLLYLSATAVALYVISQIASTSEKSASVVDLLAFWAPFLLLHLGGPDTITALALEDNELWHRHALELATQVAVTLYVFVHSVLNRSSQLWVPTVFMFVDGSIKYLERTQALYYASIDSFRDSLETEPEPGPNYARLTEFYYSSRNANIPTVIQGRDDPSSDVALPDQSYLTTIVPDPVASETNEFRRVDTEKIILEAYYFYSKFKALIGDNFLSLKDRKECRDIFLLKEGPVALRIIEIELNLMYDVFYTKAFLLDSNKAFLRVFSFLSVIGSLLWFSVLDKSSLHEADVAITYILLGGAIALDITAGIMLILSDWLIIIKARTTSPEWVTNILAKVLKLSTSMRHLDSNRWSRSISEFNLLKRCFKETPAIMKYTFIRRIRDGLIGWLYVKSDTSTDEEEDIVKYIVGELQNKAKHVDDKDLKIIKEVCSARGNLFLEDEYFLISVYLKPWTIDVDYDESLLTWHLATDICYYSRSSTDQGNHVEISKKLSDYMAYLILRQQTLVSTVVGMSDKRFADTCAEAKKFMMDKRLDTWYTDICTSANYFLYKVTFRDSSKYSKARMEERELDFKKEFCDLLLHENVDVQPIVAKGDKSKSVLFEACRLAKQLKSLGQENQWQVTSKVWLELLCYAAVRCSTRSHVAHLSKGGELITMVWLLMAHLGFGECFLQNQGFGWTKLLIQK